MLGLLFSSLQLSHWFRQLRPLFLFLFLLFFFFWLLRLPLDRLSLLFALFLLVEFT
jgi:hypothetical protein